MTVTTDASNNNNEEATNQQQQQQTEFVIVGAGIIGLTLAYALYKELNIKPIIYERMSEFHDNVGAGMGMYPNGLRVLRDLGLLELIKENGEPFICRRWTKHDGSEIAIGDESVLHKGENDDSIQSFGIARWRLHKLLLNAVINDCNITIQFGKEVKSLNNNNNNTIELIFTDNTKVNANVIFGTDGTRSDIRNIVTKNNNQKQKHKLQYTGVTCLMGIAENCPKPDTGVCCPTSSTTKCHATFFPIQEHEQCFQFYFPIIEEDSNIGNWGTLSEKVSKIECTTLGTKLRIDGWDEKYIIPLENVTRAVRVGFCELHPPLQRWVYNNKRIILLGDSAHPPVPYSGQGAQAGFEDVGTLILLLKKLCYNNNTLNMERFDDAMTIFESIRIPRVAEIHKNSISLGLMQQKQAECRRYARKQTIMIQRDIFFHETVPIMIPGAQYDYVKETNKVLKNNKNGIIIGEEEEEEFC